MSPEGGPKDVNPPVILKTSPANNSTNFKGKIITLYTDEYIQMQNASQEILMAPLPKKQPEYKLRGKNLEITLPDSLNENTTYAINFGKAIKDNNEGNVLNNYRFVFSTGNTIDSLEIKGKALDAYTGKAIENAGVFVYPKQDTGKFWLQDPINFAKTNANGEFTVSNLKPNQYQILVLIDKNQNFAFDERLEVYGFADTLAVVDLLPDSLAKEIGVFYCAQQWPDTLYIKSSSWYENKQLNAKINRVCLNCSVKSLSPNYSLVNTQWSQYKDSLSTWLSAGVPEGDSVKIELSQGAVKDTLTFFGRPERKSKKDKPQNIKLIKDNWVVGSKPQIIFPFPIATKQFTDSLFINDSTKIAVQWTRDSTDYRIAEADFTFEEGKQFFAVLDSARIKDIYGNTNDSTAIAIQFKPKENYGNLNISLSKLESREGFLVLISSKGQETYFPLNTETTRLVLKELTPDKYRLKFIWDKNDDGVWTPGNIKAKAKPEPVYFYPEIIDLRANWDTDINWVLPE